MWTVIGTLVGLLAMIIQEIIEERKRPRREYENDITAMDQAIGRADADSISEQFERLRRKNVGDPGRSDAAADGERKL